VIWWSFTGSEAPTLTHEIMLTFLQATHRWEPPEIAHFHTEKLCAFQTACDSYALNFFLAFVGLKEFKAIHSAHKYKQHKVIFFSVIKLIQSRVTNIYVLSVENKWYHTIVLQVENKEIILIQYLKSSLFSKNSKAIFTCYKKNPKYFCMHAKSQPYILWIPGYKKWKN
jgi:hypothetical protein